MRQTPILLLAAGCTLALLGTVLPAHADGPEGMRTNDGWHQTTRPGDRADGHADRSDWHGNRNDGHAGRGNWQADRREFEHARPRRRERGSPWGGSFPPAPQRRRLRTTA